MNTKRAMALAGQLGTGMLASAPAAALDLTCGGACPWVTYGDGNSFLLQYNAYIYNRVRRHSTLGYLSPTTFLQNWIARQDQQEMAA